ncbi:FumA C-terminus/TtdB family hydratase beta subunit [Thermospira aquatica]|uniref:Fumarate hydratase C-terminal domain-containing protein n=1 Tax=Thermospira aquatica TaxID=2828656 RepID=A0AAX3BDH9_9SPIR|nr:FumA C-terminus/TtdB family hydratase beta subunit [Thermospira aquatica]URA10379.1 fumarate hydratase C-terminal domain-containing protein [Thermospira aquatica]
MAISLSFPVEKLPALSCGDVVRIQGTVYTARDQAHKRLVEALKRGEELPFSLKGQLIYYCGPTPPREDGLFGSAGPTTSARMDPFTPRLIEAGVVATMGKGPRSEAVREACAKYGAVYLLTFGGAGAFLARSIRSQRLVAYPDLGAEAIYELVVEDFPAIVGIDARGRVLSEGEWFELQKEKSA